MSLKDILGSFTGQTQAKYLKQANQEASKYMQTGYDDARNSMRTGYDTSTQYYDKAYNLYNPSIEQGRQAYDFYTNALGLNGYDKATAAASTMLNNPIFNNMNNAAQDRTNALFNSRGDSAGGNAQVAAQRALQDNVFNYLGAYRDLGNRGDNAINNQANIRMKQGGNATDYYNNLGNLNYGYGASRGGQAINYGNARAQAAGTLPQNIINGFAAFMGGSPQSTNYQSGNSQAGTTQSSNNLNRYGLQFGNSFFGIS